MSSQLKCDWCGTVDYRDALPVAGSPDEEWVFGWLKQGQAYDLCPECAKALKVAPGAPTPAARGGSHDE